MPDFEGRPVFSDFAAWSDVEDALADAPDAWRAKLVTWEYALLRAETSGASRPDQWQLAKLQRRYVSSQPVMVGFFLFAYGAAVLTFTAGTGLIALREGLSSAALLLAALDAALLALYFSLARGLLGRRGRAMRLLRTALGASDVVRRQLLHEALRLDLGQA